MTTPSSGRKSVRLLTQLKQCPQPVLLISNEVGAGIVPMGELSRRFVDETGWLHQDVPPSLGA